MTEPLTRGTVWLAFREGAARAWGEDGVREVERLVPPEDRPAEGEPVEALAWVPTRWLVAWNQAAHDGPSRGEERAFHRYVAHTVDLSFGRVRRALLKIATPHLLAQRAADLWRHDHTTGTVTIARVGDHEIHGVLSDHPFTSTPVARGAITEALRHLLSLARAERVRAVHQVEGPGRLAIRFTWE